jgi:uncharacterized protein (TIGR02246 family)
MIGHFIRAGAAALAVFSLASPAVARAPGRACVTGSQPVADAEFARFNRAWATRDADLVTALFAPDALLLPTLSPVPRTDAAGIREYFVGFLKGQPRARIDSASLQGGCDWLLRAGQWTITLRDETGAPREVHARFSFLYRRKAGRWWIEHLHSSLDPAGH